MRFQNIFGKEERVREGKRKLMRAAPAADFRFLEMVLEHPGQVVEEKK